jgi:hypothetical protein
MAKGSRSSGNYIGYTSSGATGGVFSLALESELTRAGGWLQDGLTSATAGTSAYQIKQTTGTTTDGLYWVKNSNINGGTPFQVYCDMNTNGGGWILLVTSTKSQDWTTTNVLLRGTPSISASYSILQYADYFKRSTTGFQYMLGANTVATDRTSWAYAGGIWTANAAYSFASTTNANTNVTNNQWFTGGDTGYSDNGIEQRMPWLTGATSNATLTTNGDSSSNWWGTIVSNSWSTAAPWMVALNNPNYVWYWMR